MRTTRWRALAVLGAFLLVGVLASCCPYQGRCRQRSSAAPDPRSHTQSVREYPHGIREAPRAEPTWVELPVISVNVRREGDARRLIVKTRTPSGGWKVMVKTLGGRHEGEAEFQLVGLAPAAAAGLETEERTVYREVPLGRGVEQVVVRGSEGSLLMDVE